MSIKGCFRAKISIGKVDAEAGRQILEFLAAAEAERSSRMTAAEAARAAAIDVADTAAKLAARDADLALRSIEAQVNVLSTLRDYRADVEALDKEGRAPLTVKLGIIPAKVGSARAPVIGAAIRSLLTRDIHEIATGANVHYLARVIRGQAHSMMAAAIESMRPKMLGLKAETAHEFDVLAALYGDASAPAEARVAAEAFAKSAEALRVEFNGAGGAVPKRETWRLPQYHDADKVAAVTRESWKDFVRPLLDRADMRDFETGKPVSEAKFEQLLDQVYTSITSRGAEGAPTMGGVGRTMLANERAAARVLSFKDAESWRSYKNAFGQAGGVFETMMRHMADMAEDIAQLRVLGPNPQGLRRYVEQLYEREIAALRGEATPGEPLKAAATAKNIKKRVSALRRDRDATLNLWDEVTRAAHVPVDMELARNLGDVRAALHGAQMGSAVISSLTDQGTLMAATRFNGLPVMRVIMGAVRDMAEKGSEIKAAQAGLIADSLAHVAHESDRFMGETIRTSKIQKFSAAIVRASGLRRWTAALRNSFGMEFMAHAANNAEKPFAELHPRFQEAFGRYGIDAAAWDVMRQAKPWEARPGAPMLRPLDVAAIGTPEARAAADRFGRLIATEMDHAVIDADPTTRALLFAGTRPGTAKGEALRAVGMYKQFPVTFVTTQMARAFARGFDGSRMSHAALTFITMWGLGILAMQAKEVAQGRDPLTLDLSDRHGWLAMGKGLLQGGGLGVFGDLLGQDKTRLGNSWAATLAGPQAGAVETILGQFLIGNIGRSIKGEDTHFFGDALYAGARYMPGSSLWFGRLGFQREVVDQLALWGDPRAPERFRRLESEAQKNWGQRYWWRPGDTAPARGPEFAR